MYVKTLNLWEETSNGQTLHDRLMEGSIVLRPGQWVRTFPGSRPSRWVGTKRSGTMWASHWQGHRRFGQQDQFIELCRIRRANLENFFTTPTTNGE